MSKLSVFDIRRNNLLDLIAQHFEGNRSAFSRAIEKDRNMINLCLTQNAETRRNIGEKLARDIEAATGLPSGWLDQERRIGHGTVVNVGRVQRDKPAKGDMVPDALGVSSDWLIDFAHGIDPGRVRIAKVTDNAVKGFRRGDLVFVDTGVTRVDFDGLYLFPLADINVVRRVVRDVKGKIMVRGDDETFPIAEIKPAELKKLDVIGRVIGHLAVRRV